MDPSLGLGVPVADQMAETKEHHMWIDDRLFGEGEAVDRDYKCPTCGFSAITDCALLCPECRDQLELVEGGKR